MFVRFEKYGDKQAADCREVTFHREIKEGSFVVVLITDSIRVLCYKMYVMSTKLCDNPQVSNSKVGNHYASEMRSLSLRMLKAYLYEEKP